MKKLLIIVSLASCMFAGEMGLSAYGGLGLANVSYGEDLGTGVTAGMKPGANLGIQYNKLPVLIGVGMSMRGTVISVDGSDYKSTVSMNYLDISVLYPYTVGPGAAFAGLNIGMNLSATMNSDAPGATEQDWTKSDCTMDKDGKAISCMNSLDFGIALGYTYPINDDIGVSVGYYLGLADFTAGAGVNADGTLTEDGSSDKHNGILINVGYALPF